MRFSRFLLQTKPASALSSPLMKPCFQSRVYLGMTTLKELIVKRPSRQFQYLHVLLDLSSHEKEKVTVSPGRSLEGPPALSAEHCGLPPGQDHGPGFPQEDVREGPSQGLHREVCPELHAATRPSQPSVSAVRG